MEQMTARLPALFLGHGSPMNALLRNRYTDAWSEIEAERTGESSALRDRSS